MSDGVSGRSVTASQRCRPLSSRQDMCGGLPRPQPGLGIYGFVKAWRGAEARPEVGGFGVSLAAPAGFLPRAVLGKTGPAARGRSDSGSRREGHGAWPPSLSQREPPDLSHLQPPSISSLLTFTQAGPSARGPGGPGDTPAVLVALASVPPAVGRLALHPSPTRPAPRPYQPRPQSSGICPQMTRSLPFFT